MSQPEVTRHTALPLRALRVSSTHIQQLRRSHFDAAKLVELADSIRTQGLLQPILVRAAPNKSTDYEIVAGERRYLAADRAGLTEIDCIVRDLTDAQVLEAQLVENLQRADVHPMEEAEGYRELMKLKNYRAEELAERIGKSESYVRARVKLLALCADARAALDAGTIDASKALLIARLPAEKLQLKALKICSVTDWRGQSIGYRAALEGLRTSLMVDLTPSPFDFKAVYGADKKQLPACESCPNNSRNDPDLQSELGKTAHVCTDPTCHGQKVKLFWAGKRHAAEASGSIVLTGEAARAAIPDAYWGINDQYVDLDTDCRDDEFTEPEPEDQESPAWEAWSKRQAQHEERTFRQLLAAATLKPVLAETPKGELRELVPIKDAVKALKATGIELTIPKRQQSIPAADSKNMAEERAKQEARAEKERVFRARLLREIHAKWKGPLKAPELAMLAEWLIQTNDSSSAFEALYPDAIKPGSLKEPDLHRLIAVMLVADSCSSYAQPQPLLAMAKRLKIDPAKVKQQIAAEEKKKAKEEGAKPASGKPGKA